MWYLNLDWLYWSILKFMLHKLKHPLFLFPNLCSFVYTCIHTKKYWKRLGSQIFLLIYFSYVKPETDTSFLIQFDYQSQNEIACVNFYRIMYINSIAYYENTEYYMLTWYLVANIWYWVKPDILLPYSSFQFTVFSKWFFLYSHNRNAYIISSIFEMFVKVNKA